MYTSIKDPEHSQTYLFHNWPWLAAWNITSASGTEDTGSNPARVSVFRENIAMLLCIIDLKCVVWVLKKINEGHRGDWSYGS
jgi:hypothetical protein